MANAKSFRVEPPSASMQMTGTTVVMVVLMVRTMTSLMEKFVIWWNVRCTPSFSCFAFSFTRLNSTTVS